MTAGLPRIASDGQSPDAAQAQNSFAEILHLFRSDGGAPATEENWAATIGLVQGVAHRIRTFESAAHAMALDAEEALGGARAETAAAEARAGDARAEALSARQRAERAERQVEVLTRELAAAEERIAKAERRTAEVSMWLTRIHDCMTDEFNQLTISPLPSLRK